MACDISYGRNESCKSNVGGLRNMFIANYQSDFVENATIVAEEITALTAAVTSNVWLDYGEPAVKVVTSLLGLTVLVLLVIKHILDIKKEHFSHKDK